MTAISNQQSGNALQRAAVSIPRQLRFHEISHNYSLPNGEQKKVLDNVSLKAKAGSITCLVGPSGSGKTTLLRIAAGLLNSDSGEIYLDETNINNLAPEQRGIGLVFQDFALFEHLTLLENVAFGLQHLTKSERKIVAKQMLLRVGLATREHSYPQDLSGGEQQRIALARALAPRPGVLLLDEPFSGLDARLRDSIREETINILRETNATSIIITHDPKEALLLGDNIALLCDGRLEQFGTPFELFFQPKNLFAASFFSPVNIFQAVVEKNQVATPLGTFAAQDFQNGDRVKVVIRTNSLGVCDCDGNHKLQARIIDARFTGNYYRLKVGIDGLEQPLQGRLDCIGEGCATLSQNQLVGKEAIGLVPDSKGIFIFRH